MRVPIPARYALERPQAQETCTVESPQRAGVAQLAERQPSKLNVAGSIPVSRSKFQRSAALPGLGWALIARTDTWMGKAVTPQCDQGSLDR